MPPNARVCVGCKGSKVACVGFVAGEQACQRCTRLGLDCIPAPARAQGAVRKLMKRTTLNLLLADDSHKRPPPALRKLTSDAFAGAQKLPTEATMVEAVMACENDAQRLLVLRMLLRSWERIARQRNAYTLMSFVVFLCQKSGLLLSEVIGRSEVRTRAPADCGEGQSGAVPPGLGGSDGDDEAAPLTYRWKRTCYDDRMVFETNEAFEQRVCSVADLDKCWQRNVAEVRSLFAHPNDANVYCMTIAALWRRAMTAAEGTARARLDASSPVRLRVRATSGGAMATQTYKWCKLRASLAVVAGADRVTFEWEPLPDAPPAELHEPLSSPPLGDANDAEGGTLQLDDGLFDALMGSDVDVGTTALRDVGTTMLLELEEHFGT